MMKIIIPIVALAVFFLTVGTGLSQTVATDTVAAAEQAGVPSTIIDLSIWVEQIILPFIISIVGLLGGWVIDLVRKRLKINVDDSMRDAFQTGLANAAGWLYYKYGAELLKMEVSDPRLIEGWNYLTRSVPDSVSHFKVKPEDTAEKILAMAGRIIPGGAILSTVTNLLPPPMPPNQQIAVIPPTVTEPDLDNVTAGPPRRRKPRVVPEDLT